MRKSNIRDNASLFLLQIACIVHMVPNWKDLRLRVFTFSSKETDEEILEEEKSLKMLLSNLRIEAEPYVLRSSTQVDEQESFSQIAERCNQFLRAKCENTAVLFLYLPHPSFFPGKEYLETLSRLTEGLPPLLLVHGLRTVITTNL